ncbi:MAG: cell division protein FtsL [Litoreibacter sp.]
MKGVLFALAALAVMGLAYWSYSENYKTRDQLRISSSLQREIGAAREALSVLEAEWAYLNRPERLRDLAEMNFGRLQLLPIAPEQFGSVGQVAEPVPELDLSEIIGAIDVQGSLDAIDEDVEELSE